MEWLGKALEGFLQLWERGKTLLWGLAIACAGVIAILLGGAFLGIVGTAAALDSYGLPLVVGAVVFSILAALKTVESRGRPSVHIIPNNHQSLWGQHRQADGRITTQLNFRMQVPISRTGPLCYPNCACSDRGRERV
jgi:hypothetical protein